MLSLSVFICYLITIELDFMLSLSVFLLSHYNRTRLYVIDCSFCYLIMIDLDSMLSLAVFCYLIMMNFTASSVLSYYCMVLFMCMGGVVTMLDIPRGGN